MGMFINDGFDEEVFIYDDDEELEAEYSFKDELGGVHDEGLGWNPNGVFCGECSNMTCNGCPSRHSTE